MNIFRYKFHYLLWFTILTAFFFETSWILKANPEAYFIYMPQKISLQAGIVYFNMYFLIPRFYQPKSRRWIYWLMVLFTFITVGLLNNLLEISLWRKFNSSDPQNIIRYIVINLQLPARFLIFSAILKKTVDFYEQQEHIKKVELEKVKAEMDLLMAQVNPHFLLNTLNNLYGLSMENSPKTSESILMLSDILKYMLKNGTEEKVPLKMEVDLLSNYIELEKLRRENADIIFETKGDLTKMFVPPLILIPFVENAFKYGISTVTSNGFVHVSIFCQNQSVVMTVENNRPPAAEAAAIESHGIGLENVQKRLHLLFPQKHKLQTEQRPSSFFVSLKLFRNEV